MTYDPAELLSYEVSSDGRGEDAWFATTIWRWHHGSYIHTDGHSSERTLIGGQERRISVGETLKEAPTSQLSEESKVRPERGWGVISLVQKFIHYCPPPSPRLKPVSSITQIICRPQGIGDLILYVFPRIFHFISLLS